MNSELGAIPAKAPITPQINVLEKITPLSTATSTQIPSEQKAATDESAKAALKDRVTVESSPVTATALDTLKSLEGLQKRSNELAQDIRATSKNISAVTDLVTKMQSSLASITKNFPPFNVESQERQQILMSYVSIRKELEKMTIPPPPSPLYENVSNIWNKSIAKDGTLLPEAVPALQTDSSDNNVQLTEKSLQKTQENLAGLTKAVNNFSAT
jgi:uncharacterized protein YoxC